MKVTPLGMAAATFVTIFPFFTIPGLFYGDINSKALLTMFIADCLVLLAAYKIGVERSNVSIKGRELLGMLGVILGVQYLAGFVGVAFGHSLWSSLFWSSGLVFLTHLAVAGVIVSEFSTKDDWVIIRRGIAISAGAFSLLTLTGEYGLRLTDNIFSLSLASSGLTLGNETYAGAYLLLAFCIGTIEFFNSRKGAWKFTILTSLVLIVLSPLLTNIGLLTGGTPIWDVINNPLSLLGSARASSAALFAFIGFLGGYFLIRRFTEAKVSRNLITAWVVILIGLISVGLGFLFTPGSAIQEAYINTSSAARVIVWDIGREAFIDRPLLGWGPENFNFAFERHFDNRLYESQNLGEVWFERAHNVFLDTLVGSGLIGLASFALFILLYFVVIRRAHKRGLISTTESVILCAVIPVHLLQMQTGFDTVPTYVLLGCILAYVLWLEKNLVSNSSVISQRTAIIIASVLTVVSLSSMIFIVGAEHARQTALAQTFRALTPEAQRVALESSLIRPDDFESLRLSSGSFIKGSVNALANSTSEERVNQVLTFADIYERHYKKMLEAQPGHYRARMNYAYLLLVETGLGHDRIQDARAIINDSYDLSPENPLTYVLGSIAELYAGNMTGADDLMEKAVALNPRAEFTQLTTEYLKRQKEQFPNLTVINLSNL